MLLDYLKAGTTLRLPTYLCYSLKQKKLRQFTAQDPSRAA